MSLQSGEDVMVGVSRRLLLASFSALGSTAAFQTRLAAQSAKPASKERVALKGYDPVAYFTDGQPVKGSPEYSASFDGTIYQFKNAQHRAMFVADPDRYAPQYKAFCAITISRGAKMEVDPEAWLIWNGKLYMFAGKQGVDMFKEEAAGIVAKAEAAWPEVNKRP
jgi:YHS domain-containing protein